ncbi:FAD-dependent oxidoreductase [Ottowia sp.]|uniref:NAD(P)/FAD-dependent oxidoreductase n=2 Tax=Ottowia sp. TaxID=1898956 RepID=UPI002CE7AE88|nr:FAD-dependent oxidoreductase [Ottowia sp.]HOB66649.1 FAD-dependent oxidoreductase [Ottowia sp.]HPZ56977.1 FAD-dependent oxidoreductase [Ottowia sp.]HQD47462.1 FAD-dependent oxidoreductase [Ottowia sp.]
MNRHRTRPPLSRRMAVVGAGIAGLACARTLQRAGCDVQVFDAAPTPGGRLATQDTPFGTFDTGAQYFTVRDARFTQVLQATAVDVVRPWSANAVRVLDEHGRVVEAALAAREAHWVAVPSMNRLPLRWAEPLQAAGALHLGAPVDRIAPGTADTPGWRLYVADASGQHRAHAGFDAVMLALPSFQARQLLLKSEHSTPLTDRLAAVDVAPCWTLIMAFPHAAQPGLHTLGPQWNAARSTHHRVAWLARESSKPARALIERWTVQASAAWSREHQGDDPARVTAKLLKAFGEITGIRAAPAFAEAHLWRQAQTLAPLGQPFVWDAAAGIGLCGDWCTGHRVEDAFVSGLELALRALDR